MTQPEDVVVIGAGVIGLSAALALAKAGRSVCVLDAGVVGGGSSHGNCGTITPSHAPPLAAPGMVATALRMMLAPDAPLYIKPRLDPQLWSWLLRFAGRCNPHDWETTARAKSALLNESRQRLEHWVREHALDCDFTESGEDYVFRDPRSFAHGQQELPLLKELGIDAEVVDGTTYETLEPAIKPGVAGAIRFSGDAALRPDRYVSELARVLREAGGRVIEHCPMQSISGTRDGVQIHTAQGVMTARDAVVAMGAWSPRLADAIGLPWLRRTIQPGKGYSMTYAAPALTPRRPLVLRERTVCVTSWGDSFRLGSTMEFSGYDDSHNPRRLAALERGAAEYLRHPVGPSVRERWFGWRPMSCDDIPIIGRAPGRPHLWLATGHGMMGMGMSAGSGQLLADLVTGQAPAIDPAPFDPARFV